MWNDFKAFVMRGNVLDLAVAVIIGGAFGAIVTSLVNDIIMPLIGILTGGIDFTQLILRVGSAELKYGMFIQNVINFIIVALVIFMLIRIANRFKKPAPPPAVTTKECPYCFSTINLKATRCPECTSELTAGKATT
ncbi:MAG TPA: large conductance mechanosensitive channel protein MscL [Anaerolineales bacterium]